MTASITCPVCDRTSHNPTDVSQGYCGHCHDWTGAHNLVRGHWRPPFDEVAQAMFFDRQGHPITLARWSWLSAQHDYRVLGEDTLPDGIRVSTVWLGRNMEPFGPPQFIETAIFLDNHRGARYRQLYTSEAEALATHATLVRSLEMVGRSFLDKVEQEGSW